MLPGGRWLPGIARLRYTTSHPRDMSGDLVAAHADLAELAPFVHLPVQSGSDAPFCGSRHSSER